MKPHYDITVIGAGPAGLACAISLSGKGYKIAVFERDHHPGAKVCGDAISPDALGQLKKIHPGLYDAVLDSAGKHPCEGLRLFSPSGKNLDLYFGDEGKSTFGFTLPRSIFDNILFRFADSCPDIEIFSNTSIQRCVPVNNNIILESGDMSFSAAFVVGADGANSILHPLLKSKRNNSLVSMGIRTYAENVSVSGPGNLIELHYLKEIVPGYFWIFPLNNNRFNVGMGIPAQLIIKRRINLNKLFLSIIRDHPVISQRFSQAGIPDNPGSSIIPMGRSVKKFSGERFLIAGDAAGLVDPLSGEGIGNALRSGRLAARHIQEAFEMKRYDADFNMRYDENIKKALFTEFRINRFISHLSGSPWFVEQVIRMGRINPWFRGLLKKSLMSPSSRRVFITQNAKNSK
ncbi:MAG: NAD(P)/FAD-dependent oxidoreductase [Bacteroidetes bacterium]|nr:NAD(P)/FAD-dependent oxidoreductase [Bacteroidota bacterium]